VARSRRRRRRSISASTGSKIAPRTAPASSNAYAYAVVTRDFPIAVVDLERTEEALSREFKVRRFTHSLHVTAPGSRLSVQIQTDPAYATFVERAQLRNVLGLQMPVATIEDLLQGKIWAAQEPTRRRSKRLKDLSDIARILEACPELRCGVPSDIARAFQ